MCLSHQIFLGFIYAFFCNINQMLHFEPRYIYGTFDVSFKRTSVTVGNVKWWVVTWCHFIRFHITLVALLPGKSDFSWSHEETCRPKYNVNFLKLAYFRYPFPYFVLGESDTTDYTVLTYYFYIFLDKKSIGGCFYAWVYFGVGTFLTNPCTTFSF